MRKKLDQRIIFPMFSMALLDIMDGFSHVFNRWSPKTARCSQSNANWASAGPRHPPVAPTCQAIQGIDAEGVFDQIGMAVAESLKAMFTGYLPNTCPCVYDIYIYILIYLLIYIYAYHTSWKIMCIHTIIWYYMCAVYSLLMHIVNAWHIHRQYIHIYIYILL